MRSINTIFVTGLLFFFFLCTVDTVAQEVVTGLEINPMVPGTSKKDFDKRYLKSGQSLELPFIDDFSGISPLPDPSKWSDNSVFLNDTYPVNPPTSRVATFDAIDSTGKIYSHASISAFEADVLSSRPINLNYPGRNDIWLSFYYQPGGRGDNPEAQDSLMLEFFSPGLNAWKKVWSVPGVNSHAFKQVIIPVTSPEYLVNGFRFRFRNKASISSGLQIPGMRSNADHWHIDYVKLDLGRSANDSATWDVAMSKPITSLLKDHESVPWSHLVNVQVTGLKPRIAMSYRNLLDSTLLVRRFFKITDLMSTETPPYIIQGDDANIAPRSEFLFESDLANPFFSTTVDSGLFEVRAYIQTDPPDYKVNDTVKYYQKFFDYYAYDDGTPEAGYGLAGQGSANGMVAVKFRSFRADTLRAVDMRFNPTLDKKNESYYFRLAVWKDKNGFPGDLLRVVEDLNPVITPGGFYRYSLDTAIYMLGDFHVGWIQTSENYINLGLDRNRVVTDKNAVNLKGTWQRSIVTNALMIRPVFGSRSVTRSKNIHALQETAYVYPNPASEYIVFYGERAGRGNTPLTMQVYNSSGRLVANFQGFSSGEELPVGDLPRGLYMVRVLEKQELLYSGKLIIKK